MTISIPKAFLLALAIGMGGTLLMTWAGRDAGSRTSMTPAPNGRVLLERVSVREQVALKDIATIKEQGFRTLIDLRPDGEAADQPGSAAVGEAARAAGLAFAYVPTPHGDVPEHIVSDLAQALGVAERPVLLYCRSGKRAARVWALAEASRKGGPLKADIVGAVLAAGQPVDDLLPQIEARIAARAN